MVCYVCRYNWSLGTAVVISTGIALWSTYQLLKDRLFKSKRDITQDLVNHSLLYQYGTEKDLVLYPWVPKDALLYNKKCAELCAKYFDAQSKLPNRALDVSCSVGRASFELARYFAKVVGLDSSHEYIAVCQQLKQYGSLVYSVLEEGKFTSEHIAKVDDTIDRSRVHFGSESILALPSDLGEFGCILAANVLCQVKSSREFLQDLCLYLAPGGILVITTTYNWRTDTSDKGDFIDSKVHEEGKGFRVLQAILDDIGLDLIDHCDIPLLARSSARVFSLFAVHATVWKKKHVLEEED